MRNLKRALSLALASIMLLGMMVTGAGAASTSFTDFDQIVNQEAAEVTTGIGIFDGYTDGSFGPENVVTRAEMAVIICKLLNGSDVDPGNFTGISKFTDVPAWAEGYVNFCAASGIVVGVGEGKFNPSATVTTVEAATMLLKALGYFVEEDQLGADWKTVVTGRATSQGLYGSLVLKADEGLTRDNVAELLFHTLFAQRVAYDDNRHLYVKNTNRDVVVTNGTEDRENTFAMNTFGMWYIDGVVTANSCTEDSLSEAVYNAPRTNVVFDRPADYMGPANTTEYPFEYTTGLDMIAHAARVYYSMKNNAPVVYAIADRAEKVAYITYDKNNTRLADAATAAGFRKNSILNIATKDYKVNYSWDRTVGVLDTDATKQVNLTGPEIAKTLIVISNSSDCKVDYVIVLDQYLDTVKRVIERNGKTEYDLTTVDADRQTIVYDSLAEGDYVIVTDVGKEGDTFNLTKPEQVSASISKITGVSDQRGTVKSITADGTEYKGSPVFDHKDGSRALDNVTNFEDITTLGETTLLLDDTLGLCIGLAQPEAPELYAYVAQFAEKHVDGFGTEFKLVAKAYLSDGTEGTYLVNTSAGNSATNSFKGYEFASRGGDELDLLNGVKDINGNVLGYGANDANGIGHNLAVYNDNSFSMVGADDHANGVGLGVYAATLRADGSIVLAKLTTSDSAERANESEARVVTGHSTLIAQKDLAGTNIKKGDNVTFADDAVTRDRNTLYQTSKTVVFYVNGHWNDTNGKNTLTVTAKTGIDNMKGFTVQHDANDVTGFKQGDDNAWAEHFLQIGSKVDSSRREVTAELIHGLKVEDDANLYFYKQGNYEVDWVNGSKAGEQKATITFNVYDSKGELKKVTYDNNGRYFEESEINGEVKDIPTGWYTIGSQKLETVVRYDNDVKGNGVKIVGNDTHVKDDRIENDNKAKDKIFVLNAIVDHVDYENNIFTELENVGGITKDAVIVDLTGENLFDSASDIDRACKAHHVVKISYFYTISGGDSYKVKAVFVTGYDPDELDRPSEKNVNVYSEVVGGRLRTFNNWQASYVAIANEAERAFKAAGYTVTNVNPTAFYGQAENGAPRYFWAMTVAKENTTQNVTNMPYTANGNVGMMGWYVDIEDAMNKVCVNGSWRSWILSGTSTEVSVTPGTKTVPVEVTTYLTETNSVFGETVTKSIDVVSSKAVYTDSYSQFSKTINFVTNGQTGSNVVNVTDITAELKSGAEKLAVGENLDESLKVGYEYIFTSELTDEDVLYTVAWTEKGSNETATVAEAGKTYKAVVTLTVADGKDYVLTGTTTKTFEFTAEEGGKGLVVTPGYTVESITDPNGNSVDEITEAGAHTIVVTREKCREDFNYLAIVNGDDNHKPGELDKTGKITLTLNYTVTEEDIASGTVTVKVTETQMMGLMGMYWGMDPTVGRAIAIRPVGFLVNSRAINDNTKPEDSMIPVGKIYNIDFGDDVSMEVLFLKNEDPEYYYIEVIEANTEGMDPDKNYIADDSMLSQSSATEVEATVGTATPNPATGEIEEITFTLGQPRMDGVLLPSEVDVDGNVTAAVTWYNKDGQEVKYADGNGPYTYEAILNKAEGSNAEFAETVIVKTQKSENGEVAEQPVENFATEGAKVDEEGNAAVNDTVKVTFVTGEGASVVESQIINKGETAVKPADPTREGFVFAGWFTSDAEDAEAFDFTAALTASTTVYAKWSEVQAAEVTVDGFDVRVKKADSKIDLNAALTAALAESLLQITKGDVTPTEADSAVETDITWSVKGAEEGAAAPETADDANAIYVATVKLKIAAANTAEYVLDKEYSKDVEFAVDATEKTPIEKLEVTVTGAVDAGTVPTFEPIEEAGYYATLSGPTPEIDKAIGPKSNTTYTWTVTVTARNNSGMRMTEDTVIDLLTEDQELKDRITVEKNVLEGTFTLSVTTDKASESNNDIRQLGVKYENQEYKITFYAYYGPDGMNPIQPMNKFDIADALTAAGYPTVSDNVTMDGDNSKAVANSGQILKFTVDDTSEEKDGGCNDPKAMYEITKPDGTKVYAWPEGELTGLGNIAGVLPEGTYVSKKSGGDYLAKTGNGVDGVKVELPGDQKLTKDTTYVEAFELDTSWNPVKAGALTSKTEDAISRGDTPATIANVTVLVDGKSTALNAAKDVHEVIAEGTVVTIAPVGGAVSGFEGKTATFKVNGKTVATGKFDADGMLSLTGTYEGKSEFTVKIEGVNTVAANAEAGKGKVTFDVETGFVVMLDDKTLTANKEGTYDVGTGDFACQKTEDEVTSLVALAEELADGVYTASADDADEDGVIRLYTVYKVNTGENDVVEMYTGFDGTKVIDEALSGEVDKTGVTARANAECNYVRVKADGTADLWVKAKGMNTEIVTADGVTAAKMDGIVSSKEGQQNPTMFREGVWHVIVKGNVTGTDFKEGLKLVTEDSDTLTGQISGAITPKASGVATIDLGAEGATLVKSLTPSAGVVGVTYKGEIDGENLKITVTNNRDENIAVGQNDASFDTIDVVLKSANGLEMTARVVLKVVQGS